MVEDQGRRDYDDEMYEMDDGPDISQGLFFQKDTAKQMRQAVKNLGGIQVEEVGDVLADGTENPNPQTKVAVKVTREDNPEGLLTNFWKKVERLREQEGLGSSQKTDQGIRY